MGEMKELTTEAITSLQVGKVFKDNTRHITSIDFDGTGTSCVTASDDESIRCYDCRNGK